ncbi:uncharacterized protein EHS24_009039 [Apiotrichum porosum]|uniref:Serum paraoxonase/arylesterase 2 n=1 Tax=Apiotrichum porosum TaxID=105984 RepID=A0A427XNH0_9TREE|nr:uncharacterized protein EHS24_009039 [Apiotrichum porosum]RSH80459.1 hypothetical protein EHS24_009039 [Apiotrichum porosum]
MPPPITFLAFPPLLALYPLSYVVWLVRTLALPIRVKTPKLLSNGTLVDPTATDPPLVKHVGSDQLPFSEDVIVWQAHRLAIFSSDPGRPFYNPFTNEGDAATAPHARLMLYDLDKRTVRQLEIGNWPEGRTLHSLGLGLKEDDNGGAILAVVNIGADFTAVDMVRLAPPTEPNDGDGPAHITATYLHSLENPKITTPNAVVPLSEDQVVVTNSFGFSPKTHKVLNTVETILAIPGGKVYALRRAAGSFPGIQSSYGTFGAQTTATCELVAERFALANGIAASPDGRILLVAGTNSDDVSVYDVDPSGAGPGSGSGTGAFAPRVHFRETLPVGFLLDNLRYVPKDAQAQQAEGYTFLGAGHPAGLDVLAATESKGKKLAGSRVVKIHIPVHRPPPSLWRSFTNELSRLFTRVHKRVELVFADSGELVSTSATAVAFTGKTGTEVLVTGVWDGRGPVHLTSVDV